MQDRIPADILTLAPDFQKSNHFLNKNKQIRNNCVTISLHTGCFPDRMGLTKAALRRNDPLTADYFREVSIPI